MQNELDVDQITVTAENLFQDVSFLPLAGKPHKYIRVWGGTNMEVVWNGTGPFPNFGNSPYWGPMTGSRVVLKNWQGTGKDYLLFYNSQLGSHPSWHSDPGGYNVSNPPIKGLTMQQAWETLGMGYEGDVVKDSEALTLDGIIDGYARAGLGVSLGPPRAVVTFPTMREAARIENNVVKIFALPTGDSSNASDFLMVSLDGAPAIKATNGGSGFNPVVAYSTHISPGVHTVKAWRTYKNKPTVMIQGSEFSSQYCIGTCAGVPQGHFSFSSTTFDFSGVSKGSRPNSQALTVTNTGGAAVNASVVPNQPWCHTNPVNLFVVAGDSKPVSVYVDSPSNLGNLSCIIAFHDPTSDNSGAAITVNYVVGPGGL